MKNQLAQSRQRSDAVFALHQSELIEDSKATRNGGYQSKPIRRPHSQAQRREGIYKRAVLPKTATNFYNMQKGLYMKTLKTPKELMMNRNMTNKSLNLLNAYGELAT